MICPKCKTKYYSKTSCPKCGLEAFSLNKGRRMPSKAGYRGLYTFTIAAFLIVIFIALTFFQFSGKTPRGESSVERAGYPNIKRIKIIKSEKNATGTVSPAIPIEIEIKDNKELNELNKKGFIAFNEADYNRAFIYFYQAYEVDSDNITIKKNLYNTLIAKGSESLSNNYLDDAIKNFNDSLKYIDDDFNAYQGLGVSYFTAGEKENALSSFLTAYNYRSNSDELKFSIAKVYFSMKDYDNSKKFIDLIKNKSQFSPEIGMYTKIADKNISEVKDKSATKTSHFNVYYDGYEDPIAGSFILPSNIAPAHLGKFISSLN
ncbi:tetratricopeptide repeat protein, partial [Thermodesulfobacteriota bacterium]